MFFFRCSLITERLPDSLTLRLYAQIQSYTTLSFGGSRRPLSDRQKTKRKATPACWRGLCYEGRRSLHGLQRPQRRRVMAVRKHRLQGIAREKWKWIGKASQRQQQQQQQQPLRRLRLRKYRHWTNQPQLPQPQPQQPQQCSPPSLLQLNNRFLGLGTSVSLLHLQLRPTRPRGALQHHRRHQRRKVLPTWQRWH